MVGAFRFGGRGSMSGYWQDNLCSVSGQLLVKRSRYLVKGRQLAKLCVVGVWCVLSGECLVGAWWVPVGVSWVSVGVW